MRAICKIQLKEKKGGKDLMLILGLNETIVHPTMASDSLVLGMASDLYEEEGWSCFAKGIRA